MTKTIPLYKFIQLLIRKIYYQDSTITTTYNVITDECTAGELSIIQIFDKHIRRFTKPLTPSEVIQQSTEPQN